MNCYIKIKTAVSLGLFNVLRVWYYRLSVTVGINPVRRLNVPYREGLCFKKPNRFNLPELQANSQWFDKHSYFGWCSIYCSRIPDWHRNPFKSKSVDFPASPWWMLPDFDPRLGDIKTVWEASRFDWVLGFAQSASRGVLIHLSRLNEWLTDWIKENPPYLGPNWKCGQEASIRVMHLAMAALILDQVRDPEPILIALIRTHLKRIAPTITYAIAQDNNHGTSEAAALFIGGSWLQDLGDSEGKKWQVIGRKWLENRAKRLIENDGSFSQYSVTYHRVMLDTYCMVEVWRRSLELPLFSNQLYSQLFNAAQWLYQFTQPETGDAPNLGANDGARLLPLSNTDYRDFRPSVQLSMALFCGCRAYQEEGAWNQPLKWLNVTVPERPAAPLRSLQFDSGGYSLLRKGSAFVMLTYPRYRFRPSQADALHLDFWLDGENLLRDAGTYSYHSGDEYISYFGGTEGHNTVQFDNRDQMPRLSRFLFGNWLETDRMSLVENSAEQVRCSAGYTDSQGACHHRSVCLDDRLLSVVDHISGFREKAILRWRLKQDNWQLEGNVVSNGLHQLTIKTDLPVQRIELVAGLESRYYMNKCTVPVLEIEVNTAGSVLTEYKYKQ